MGNGWSSIARISADGEWLAFNSQATDLVPSIPDTNSASDVFLFHRPSGAISLITKAHGGERAANGSSWLEAMSRDGEWLVLGTLATDLAAGVEDRNGGGDVYLYQRSTGAVTLVSRAAGGGLSTGDGWATGHAVSDNGQHVTFGSSATNHVAGVQDSNNGEDAFLFNRLSGRSILVSRSARIANQTGDGFSAPRGLSADGKTILIASGASDLVTDAIDTNGRSDVFIYQEENGTPALISRSISDPTAIATPSEVSQPVLLSRDGRHVLFFSMAHDLAEDYSDGNGSVDAFISRIREDSLLRDGFEPALR
jgi:Tol biopolymer transport system component